jgi:hypothetical protein
MRLLPLLLLLPFCAAPAAAQSRVYTNADLGHPRAADARPDPAEAVAVLRGSHSIADYTDRHVAPDDGPTFVILGGSPTAGPYGEFRPFGPDRRLDGTPSTDPPWEQFAYVGRSYGPGVSRATHARRQGVRSAAHVPASVSRSTRRR